MRAAVLHSPAPVEAGPLDLVDSASPADLAPDDVRIEVSACAVCRTDVQICEGDLPAPHLPLIPGHQIVGYVREAGAGVEDLRVGDRVGVTWLGGTCGVCRFCRNDRENLCRDAVFTGLHRDGGFAQQVTADHRFVFRLPPGDDVEQAPLLCGGVIGWRCLRMVGPVPRMRLGLYGFGASASLVVQLAKHFTIDCFVVTRSEREQERAMQLGAVWAGSYDDKPPVPLDAAITFAPVGSVVIEALRAVDRGGSVIINAIHLDHIPEFDYDLLWHERSVRSVANVTRDDAMTFFELLPHTPIDTRYTLYDLADANRALWDAKDGRVDGAAVLVPWVR